MRFSLSVILILCLLTACNELSGEKQYVYEEEYTKTIELSGQTKLILESTNGGIDIVGSDTTDKMYLEITKRVRSYSLEDAEEHVDDITITDERRPQEVYVEVEHPISTDRDYGIDFVIILPTHFDFEIYSGNGDISLSSTTGNSELILGNGNIELDNAESTQIRAELGNGNIDADVVLMDSCSVNLSAGNGNVTLTIPEDTNAEVEASVGNGQITHTGLSFQDLEVSSRRLEGVLGDGKGSIVLYVGNGNIGLRGK